MQTLLRHLLTALGGALLIDTSNTQALIGGLVCIGCTVLWSYMSKVSSFTDHYHISDDKVTLLKKLVAVLVSQGFAALSGWLMANGFEADPNDPVAVSLFLANFGASKMGWTQKVIGLRPVLMLALCSSLCSCSSFTSADAKYAGEQIGLAAADTAILVARMQLAQANAELEAAKHEPGANNNAILAKQLGVIAAQQALNAAERAIAKERARLDAKQPRNVQPTISQITHPHDRALAVRGRDSSPPITVSTASARPFVPVYAPQVVAMLKAR